MARVLHVVSKIGPGGGPTGYTYRLQKAFAEFPCKEHQVDFLELPARRETFGLRRSLYRGWHRLALKFRLETVHQHSVRWRLFSASAQTPWEPRVWDCDYLFLHDPVPAFDIIRYRRPGCRVIIATHAPTPIFAELAADEDPRFLLDDCLKDKFLLRVADWELRTYQQADYLFAPCEEAHDAYRAVGGPWATLFQGKNVITCFSGSPEPLTNRSPQEWRDELGVRADQVLGVCVGRNHPHKGTDLIISALQNLSPTIRERLVFVFAGFKKPGPPIPGVRYVNFTLDIGGLVAASDFAMNGNRYTNFDLFALEVLSLGRPLLATDVGGNVRLAKVSTGVRLTQATVEGVKDGIEKMAQLSSSELAELGRANRCAWETWFSPSRFRDHHVALYNRLGNGNG